MTEYFKRLLHTIETSVEQLDMEIFAQLLEETVETLEHGGRIIVSGLGKNVPMCEKFVGTMHSLGLEADFLHTNSAVHGDLGVVRSKDLVILLTKSGETSESIYLAHLLKERRANLWLMTFTKGSTLESMIPKSLVLQMDHEGDLWDIVPNNSTTLYLIMLQALAIKSAERVGVTLEEFKQNHPGGHIGVVLQGK